MNAPCPHAARPSASSDTVSDGLLALEFAVLFGLPLVLVKLPFRVNPIPLLWLATLYCLWILRNDREFDREKLGNRSAVVESWPRIVVLFGAVALALTVIVFVWARPLLFGLLRRRPWLWAIVMVLYPLLSVYPQGIVYRVFVFQRYRRLFRKATLLVPVSAAVFSLAHVLLHNWLAVGFTFLGGLLFAWRYRKTGSLLASTLEHALYGCWMFTVGLGQYFYHAVR